METLLIQRDKILELTDLDALQAELKRGFINYSNGSSRRDGKRIVLDIGNENKTTLLGPGTSAGIPAYTIKANSKFPGQPVAIKGVIALFDIDSGDLLALIDSSTITSIRTGLSAAMATHALADPKARTLAVVGAGNQNMLQLEYLLKLRKLDSASIFDVDPARTEAFRKTFAGSLSCKTATSLSQCVEDADIVLVATWSKNPLLDLSLVPHPCHVTSLGSDEMGKVELSSDLVLHAEFYVDDIDLNMLMGTPGNLGLGVDCIKAEIGKVFSGEQQIDRRKKRHTVYSCVGLPFQDLVTAWHIYRKALLRKDIVSVAMN